MGLGRTWMWDWVRHSRRGFGEDPSSLAISVGWQWLVDGKDYGNSRLRSAYVEYVAQISSPDMAMSLEAAETVFQICEHLEPKRILDLGSGFSSFVFRLYSAQASHEPLVVSVDDSPEWLKRTERFLRQQELPTTHLTSWEALIEEPDGAFDLLFHDLGDMVTRARTLPTVLEMASSPSSVVLDDLHKRPYRRVVKRVSGSSGFRVVSLRDRTLDEYGRFSSVALLP